MPDTLLLNIRVKPKIFIKDNIVDFVFQKPGNVYGRKKSRFNYILNVATNNPSTNPNFLIIKDLNEISYLSKTDPLQIAERYIALNKEVPSLDTINKVHLPREYNYFNRAISLD